MLDGIIRQTIQNNSKSMRKIIDYSVSIRTLGNAGVMYERCIQSIAQQTIQPKEIIVVIDDKDKITNLYKCGLERFIVSRRGMIQQRVAGINNNTSDWLMLLDDDVAFPPDFAERCFALADRKQTQVVATVSVSADKEDEVMNGLFTPRIVRTSKIQYLVNYLIGVSTSTDLGNYAIRIWETGGFKSNQKLSIGHDYFTESAMGAFCLATKNAYNALHFDEEMWLEQTPYAFPDDQVMFYKFVAKGYRIALSPDIPIVHLDAQTGNPKSDRKVKIAYAAARNTGFFWYRFLWQRRQVIHKSGCILLLSFSRRVIFTLLSALIKGAVRLDFSLFYAYFQGYVDMLKLIKGMGGKMPRI